MNIVESKFINDIDLAICIFPADTIQNKDLSDKMIEFTKFYALRLNQLALNSRNTIKIYECLSIDDGMNRYANTHKNILFMAAGVSILDMSILFDIKSAINENSNNMAFGHILDWKEDWYELHHQFVLVNSENWLKCGKPQYGGWRNQVEELPVIERSNENFHDDYTPLWIRYTGEYKQQKHAKQGWNYFNASCRHGFEIGNWNKAIRSKRTYYYPEERGLEFLESINNRSNLGVTNPNQIRLINMLNKVSDQIWLINSELIKIEFKKEKFATAAFPAAGFKFLEIFNKNKLMPDGKLIIYDFNPKSVRWLRTIHQNTKTPLELIKEFPHKENFKCLGYTVFSDSGEFNQEFLDSYNRTVSHFGGMDNFSKLIAEYRFREVKFLEVDLYNSPEILCQELTENSFVSISNIFCTDYANTFYGMKETKKRYDRFISQIPDDSQISGFDSECRHI